MTSDACSCFTAAGGHIDHCRSKRICDCKSRRHVAVFSRTVAALLTVVIVCLPGASCFQTEATFDKSAYIYYNVSKDGIATVYDRITLRLRTNEPYGMLLYGCGKQGDFISLALERGKLVYSANLGSTSKTSGVHGLVIGGHIADDKWHQITITRRTKFIRVTLDNATSTVSSPGSFNRLDLDDVIFVAGLDSRKHCGLETSALLNHNFRGCLADVRFNSIDIIYGTKYGLSNYHTHGQLSYECRPSRDHVIGFHSRISYVALHHTSNDLHLNLDIRTFEPNGIITSLASDVNRIQVLLIEGKLTVIMHGHGILLTSALYLSDGNWHALEVVLMRHANTLAVAIDGSNNLRQLPTVFGLISDAVYVGHSRFDAQGFVGCVRNLKYDSKPIDIDTLPTPQKNAISKSCNPQDMCFPSPCQNGGRCKQNYGLFLCDCSGTEFIGDRCERSVYKRTCDEIHKAGQTRNGMYKISPDNRNTFEVYCRMNDTNGAATILFSDQGNKTKVGTTGLSRMFFFHQVRYNVDLSTASLIADISISCRQFIRYDCYNSKLLDSVRRYQYEHLNGGRWISRDGTIQTYWGGATPRSKMCACGMTRSCHLYNLDCNCDSGTKEWLHDSGFLTAKDDLPVTSVQFNVKQTNPSSMFTVGNLECYGTIPPPSTMSPPITTVIPFIKTGHRFTTPISPAGNSTSPNDTSPGVVARTINIEHDDIFPMPYLVTIVVVGTILCILLLALLAMTFKDRLLHRLRFRRTPPKPCIQIEEYDRYSSAASSDWDFQLSAGFPISTPDESTTASDDDVRVRTLEDVRGRKHFMRRLGGWRSRTASAPALPGRPRRARRPCSGYKSDSYYSSRATHTSHDPSSTSYMYETSSSSSKLSLQSSSPSTQCDYPSDTDSSQFSCVTDDSLEKKLTDRGVGDDSVIDDSNSACSRTSSEAERHECLPHDASYNDVNAPKSGLCHAHQCQHAQAHGTQLSRPPVRRFYQLTPSEDHLSVPWISGARCPISNSRPALGKRSIPMHSYTVYAHPTIQEIEGDEEEEYREENFTSAKEHSALLTKCNGMAATVSADDVDNHLPEEKDDAVDYATDTTSEKLVLLKRRVMEQATSNRYDTLR